ncbi:unnamed protein product [Amoebophrya sp. A25]|nr:unnamed protein product [Amoebophrya sp. A25]|eukprot:GSA25T00027105001.1
MARHALAKSTVKIKGLDVFGTWMTLAAIPLFCVTHLFYTCMGYQIAAALLDLDTCSPKKIEAGIRLHSQVPRLGYHLGHDLVQAQQQQQEQDNGPYHPSLIAACYFFLAPFVYLQYVVLASPDSSSDSSVEAASSPSASGNAGASSTFSSSTTLEQQRRWLRVLMIPQAEIFRLWRLRCECVLLSRDTLNRLVLKGEGGVEKEDS